MSEENKFSLSEWSSEQRPLPTRSENEDYGDYFRRLLSEWSYRAKEAKKIHEKWKTKLEWSGGIRQTDCLYRVYIVLKELFDSAFLKDDYIDTGMPKADCVRAIQELELLGFEDLCQMEGADWKFALLCRHLRKQGEKRVIIDEKMAGFYIDEVREQITEDAAEAFFRFATFTKLAYQELERIAPVKPKKQDVEVSPEQEAVRDFVNKIICLADSLYEKYNGKRISPGVHQPEVEIVIKREKLIKRMQSKMKSDFDELKQICYPEDSTTKGNICRFVKQLKRDDFFGKLPNNLLAEVFGPIIGLKEGSVKNYLSQS